MTTRTAPFQRNAWSARATSTPLIFLDGYQVGRGWGRSVFPSWPGRHHLYVHVRQFGQVTCRADLVLDIHPGQLVELQYMTPKFLGSASLTYVARR